MKLPPHIVQCIAGPEMMVRIDAYIRAHERLSSLVDHIEEDRLSNRYRTGGWFSGPPAPIQTETREVEAQRLAAELEAEYAEIEKLCPIANSLAPGAMRYPKGWTP